MEWKGDGSFVFLSNTRPAWITEAKNMALAKGEDRRHGLHGAVIITKACEGFINNELKKSGRDKTHKKLAVNLTSRLLPRTKLSNKSLEALIEMFRKYAFGKVSNLLPGASAYNRGIESVRKVVTTAQGKLRRKFFGQGEMASEVPFTKYQREAVVLLRPKKSKTISEMKQVINDILSNVVIPRLKQSSTILELDQVLTSIIDSTKVDIAFSETKAGKRFNKRVLDLDTRIKRGLNNGEGLTQEIFNKLIGYRPRRKRTKKKG